MFNISGCLVFLGNGGMVDLGPGLAGFMVDTNGELKFFQTSNAPVKTNATPATTMPNQYQSNNQISKKKPLHNYIAIL